MWRRVLLLRLAVYGLVAGVALTSLLVAAGALALESRAARRCAVWSGLALAGLLCLGAVLVRRRPCWLRWADVLAGNAVAVLVLLELVVLAWAHWFPSPLAWDHTDAEAAIRAHRLRPGSSYFGRPVNSLGYHDDEFFVADEDDVVIALLADSFGVGTVPHPFCFATIAERRLAEALRDSPGRRVAVHDFGVSSIGPAQYVLLADREVPRYRPTAVVVCLFVGNDVTEDSARLHGPRLHAFQGWASWRLVARLLAIRDARETVERLAAIGRTAAGDPQVPAWIHDPSLEVATFPPDRHLQLEASRAEVTRAAAPGTLRGFERLWTAIDYLASRLGERLGLVLIPDEFQVDDALWQAILATKDRPSDYDRFSPQRRILDHCVRRDIAVLDLTPRLRDEAKGGAVRLYHLRDTHWNAAGNRVAGEALAQWLGERLGF